MIWKLAYFLVLFTNFQLLIFGISNSNSLTNEDNQTTITYLNDAYCDKVQSYLTVMSDKMERAEGNSSRTVDVDEFKRTCDGDHGIVVLASEFETILKLPCRRYSVDQLMEIDVVVNDLFECVLGQSKANEHGDEFDMLQSDVRHRFYSLTLEESKKINKQICDEVSKNVDELTETEMLEKVIEMLIKRRISESGCIIGFKLSLYNYSHEAGKQILQLIENDGIQMFNVAKACGNVLYPNSSESAEMDRYVKNINKDVKETLSFVKFYIFKKQIQTINLLAEKTKSFLLGQQKNYKHQELPLIAFELYDHLNGSSIFLPGYKYTVILFTKAAENFIICNDIWCNFSG